MKALLIKEELQEAVQQLGNAFRQDNEEEFAKAMVSFSQKLEESIVQEAREEAKGIVGEHDRGILMARGAQPLTTEETQYYRKVIKAMQSENPKQELSDIPMPETVIDRVFDDLEQDHPLLSRINFQNVNANVKIIVSKTEDQLAKWGALNSKIVEELEGNFAIIETGKYKLSAFLPVSKDMLILGPKWIDRYVRTILMQALALGMENAIINGTGKDEPIGMIRQVGDDVTVTGGVYPAKTPVKLTSIEPVEYGKFISRFAKNSNGKARIVTKVLAIVNPVDYLSLIMPATTVKTPDGKYVKDVWPFPTDCIQSTQVPEGKAVWGLDKKYFATAGMAAGGKIEFSDEYRFLEDERVYIIKTLANGQPLDNNDFAYVDISEIQPYTMTVNTVTKITEVPEDTSTT